ncbi:adenine deaminase [Nitratireductor sp. ZSWI3]|uniref:adenine deaminase n=1 Tax=Nitratireductor sp. ZSWI3 TaxID=2966359 RepID=UPI00214F7B41|nr:adenine deaminase C-terminal domain-containing protein [Nitratireductor sp. ZSWI3]MCR4265877.1 amidohydrolase family protein [Nitratireductor sp. ZSWI3]
MNARYTEPHDLADRALRDRAVAAARGDAPFDLLIRGGRVFDAATGTLCARDVGITGRLIASVHAPAARADSRRTVEAEGLIVAPGLIDMHMHVESSMITPAAYAEAVLPRGVTTIVWDPHEFANVHGLAGVSWALDACADLPLRVVVLAPSCVPSAPGLEQSGAAFGGAELADMLAQPGIGGVAEVMDMRGVVDRAGTISDVVQAGLESGKPVFGHARGLAGSDLNAFMAAGVTSDHELTSADDLMAKLGAGLTIELRGSHDHLLPEFVAALNGLGHLPSTVTLCTDDVFPDDLARAGGLDDVVRRLVRYGMPAAWALQAATLNASHRLARPDLGLVAAGRRADLALFEDLSAFNASLVVANGALAAEGGRMLAPTKGISSAPLKNSIRCRACSPDDFRVRSEGRRVKVATIHRPRFTEWGEAETDVRDGFVVPPEGATLISVIHRHGLAPAVPRTGYLTGWGSWRGAFCTTVSHDSHNVTVFGGNEEDMAVAANWVIEAGGGMAVARDGRVIASLALPLSGLVSEAPLADIAEAFTDLREAMDGIVDWQPPYLVFKACFGATLACNAGPHQTDLGIADIARPTVMETPVLKILG